VAQAGSQRSVPQSIWARSVLIDTGAFVAIAEPGDAHHESAVDCLEELAERAMPLLVTIPTIYETHRRLLYGPRGRDAARQFLNAAYDGSITVLNTASEDEARALELIDRYWDFSLTLVDAANMAVMERQRIATVFSYDRHFLQAGFIRIPPLFL
jgi:predicted nucleic acid-binding protein